MLRNIRTSLTEIEIIPSDNQRTWGKSLVDNFDVHMGANDSAQVADLIRINILDTLGRIVNVEQVGLYQDDGIIFIPDSKASWNLTVWNEDNPVKNTIDYQGI